MDSLLVGFDDIGIGGSLSMSCVAREYYMATGSKLIVKTYHPELYDNNEYIDGNYLYDSRCITVSAPPHSQQDLTRHYNYYFCKCIGIDPVSTYPYMNITHDERAYIRAKYNLPDTYICLHSRPSNSHPERNKGRWTTTKDWYDDRWTEVVHYITEYHNIPVVQVRVSEEPHIVGTIDTCGTNIREACAIIAESMFLIGCISYSMHVAAALMLPAVIIYGGREYPSNTGYPNLHTCIYNGIECAPCYGLECNNNVKCMDSITSSMVMEAIDATVRDIR